MKRNRLRPVWRWAVVLLLVAAASALACLLLSAPWDARVATADRHLSPDRRWVLTAEDVDSYGRASERAILARADGSGSRRVYWGPAADFAWAGADRIVFTELESRARHAVAISGGSYDHRLHRRGSLAVLVVCTLLPGILVLLVGTHFARRGSARRDSSATALGRSAPVG